MILEKEFMGDVGAGVCGAVCVERWITRLPWTTIGTWEPTFCWMQGIVSSTIHSNLIAIVREPSED